jgi:hypothetical protein
MEIRFILGFSLLPIRGPRKRCFGRLLNGRFNLDSFSHILQFTTEQ